MHWVSMIYAFIKVLEDGGSLYAADIDNKASSDAKRRCAVCEKQWL